MSEDIMIPRKVRRKAAQLGVHADCLAAGTNGACGSCIVSINDAFTVFYGDIVGTKELTEAILADLEADDREDG